MADNDNVIGALRKAMEVLEEVVNADLLLDGTDAKDEAVSAIILLGEAIEEYEVPYEEEA
tara:strand:- start:514 stop:693 length:180 start_codon:yes stop_codon:yes gene_type:complete